MRDREALVRAMVATGWIGAAEWVATADDSECAEMASMVGLEWDEL